MARRSAGKIFHAVGGLITSGVIALPIAGRHLAGIVN
jgi:hypothetical protein